jgi:hypothetical protein
MAAGMPELPAVMVMMGLASPGVDLVLQVESDGISG